MMDVVLRRYTRRLAAVFAIVALVTLSGCSVLPIANFFLVGSHFDLTEGIAYGPGDRERLDVYTPRGIDDPMPVVIFLYGGRWQSGSRDMYRLIGDNLTRRGIVTVVADYSLYPDAIFPTWVEEGARAVAWVHENAEEYGGDPRRVFVVGHSAGAHTATLLDLDDRYLRAVGLPRDAVRGYVSISGPVATEWTDEDVQALMGPRSGWDRTYALQLIDPDAQPLLLLHGEGDGTVSPRNSLRLASEIREAGGCARAITYPDIGHVEIIVALMAPWLDRAPVRDDLVSFVTDPVGYAGCD